jgi:hypothetical protein
MVKNIEERSPEIEAIILTIKVIVFSFSALLLLALLIK